MDDIMKEQGFTSSDLAATELGLEPEKYRTQSSVSLSTPLGEDEFTLGDTLSDGLLSDAAMDKLSLVKQLAEVLNTLDPREKYVISSWFGINGEQTRSRTDVAKELGVSEERIEQIFHKGIRKLKASSRSRLLRPYVS
jgi:RNA polymerase primary sigma factor